MNRQQFQYSKNTIAPFFHIMLRYSTILHGALYSILFLFLYFNASIFLYAQQTCTWTGAGTPNTDWSIVGNWNCQGGSGTPRAPGINDMVIFSPATNAAVTLTNSAPQIAHLEVHSPTTITFPNPLSVTNTVLITDNASVVITGDFTIPGTGTISIYNGILETTGGGNILLSSSAVRVRANATNVRITSAGSFSFGSFQVDTTFASINSIIINAMQTITSQGSLDFSNHGGTSTIISQNGSVLVSHDIINGTGTTAGNLRIQAEQTVSMRQLMSAARVNIDATTGNIIVTGAVTTTQNANILIGVAGAAIRFDKSVTIAGSLFMGTAAQPVNGVITFKDTIQISNNFTINTNNSVLFEKTVVASRGLDIQQSSTGQTITFQNNVHVDPTDTITINGFDTVAFTNSATQIIAQLFTVNSIRITITTNALFTFNTAVTMQKNMTITANQSVVFNKMLTAHVQSINNIIIDVGNNTLTIREGLTMAPSSTITLNAQASVIHTAHNATFIHTIVSSGLLTIGNSVDSGIITISGDITTTGINNDIVINVAITLGAASGTTQTVGSSRNIQVYDMISQNASSIVFNTNNAGKLRILGTIGTTPVRMTSFESNQDGEIIFGHTTNRVGVGIIAQTISIHEHTMTLHDATTLDSTVTLQFTQLINQKTTIIGNGQDLTIASGAQKIDMSMLAFSTTGTTMGRLTISSAHNAQDAIMVDSIQTAGIQHYTGNVMIQANARVIGDASSMNPCSITIDGNVQLENNSHIRVNQTNACIAITGNVISNELAQIRVPNGDIIIDGDFVAHTNTNANATRDALYAGYNITIGGNTRLATLREIILVHTNARARFGNTVAQQFIMEHNSALKVQQIGTVEIRGNARIGTSQTENATITMHTAQSTIDIGGFLELNGTSMVRINGDNAQQYTVLNVGGSVTLNNDTQIMATGRNACVVFADTLDMSANSSIIINNTGTCMTVEQTTTLHASTYIEAKTIDLKRRVIINGTGVMTIRGASSFGSQRSDLCQINAGISFNITHDFIAYCRVTDLSGNAINSALLFNNVPRSVNFYLYGGIYMGIGSSLELTRVSTGVFSGVSIITGISDLYTVRIDGHLTLGGDDLQRNGNKGNNIRLQLYGTIKNTSNGNVIIRSPVVVYHTQNVVIESFSTLEIQDTISGALGSERVMLINGTVNNGETRLYGNITNVGSIHISANGALVFDRMAGFVGTPLVNPHQLQLRSTALVLEADTINIAKNIIRFHKDVRFTVTNAIQFAPTAITIEGNAQQIDMQLGSAVVDLTQWNMAQNTLGAVQIVTTSTAMDAIKLHTMYTRAHNGSSGAQIYYGMIETQNGQANILDANQGTAHIEFRDKGIVAQGITNIFAQAVTFFAPAQLIASGSSTSIEARAGNIILQDVTGSSGTMNNVQLKTAHNIAYSITIAGAFSSTIPIAQLTIQSQIVSITGNALWTQGQQIWRAYDANTAHIVLNASGGGTTVWKSAVTIDASQFSLFILGNMVLSMPNLSLIVRNLYAFNGDIRITGTSANAQTQLQVNGSFVALGAHYAAHDTNNISINNNRFLYPYSTTIGSVLDGGVLRDARLYFANTASANFTDLSHSVITVGNNFYNNGAAMNATALWELRNTVANNTIMSSARGWNFGTRFSVAFNSSTSGIQWSQAQNIVIAENNVVDGGNNNANWFFSANQNNGLWVTEVAIVSDRVLAITFNQPISNAQGRIADTIVNPATITQTHKPSIVRFETAIPSAMHKYFDAVYIAKPFSAQNNAHHASTYTMQNITTIYMMLQAPAWNTSSTITNAIASIDSNDTDGLGQIHTNPPGIRIDAGAFRTTTSRYNRSFGSEQASMGTQESVNIIDKAGPVIAVLEAGRFGLPANATVTTGQKYDGHNFFRIKYSEAIQAVGIPAVGTTAEISNMQVQKTSGFGGHMQDIIVGGTHRIEIAGFFSYTTTQYAHSNNYFMAYNRTNPHESAQALYITSDRQELFIIVSGYQAGMVSMPQIPGSPKPPDQLVWPGYHKYLERPDVNGVDVQFYNNTKISDAHANVVNSSYTQLTQIGSASDTSMSAFFAMNITGSALDTPITVWDSQSPEIARRLKNNYELYAKKSGYISAVNIHLLDNSSDNRTTPIGPHNMYWNGQSATRWHTDERLSIRDSAWAGNSAMVIKKFSMGTMDNGALQYENKYFNTMGTEVNQLQFNTPVTTVSSPINVVNDGYITLTVQAPNPWGNTKFLYYKYDETDGYITDLAGNMLLAFDAKMGIESRAPYFDTVLAIHNTSRMYVHSNDGMIDKTTRSALVPNNFVISAAKPLTITSVTIDAVDENNGATDFFLNFDRPLTLDDILHTTIHASQQNPVSDVIGNIMDHTSIRSITDVAINVLIPEKIRFGSQQEPDLLSGKGNVPRTDFTLEVRATEDIGSNIPFMYYILNVPDTVKNARGFWFPNILRGVNSIAYSKDGRLLRAHKITNTQYEFLFKKELFTNNINTMEFYMRIGNLPVATVESTDNDILDPRNLIPWRVHVGGEIMQLDNVTILNNTFMRDSDEQTTILYTVKNQGLVTITVYSISGAIVRTLEQETKIPGDYMVSWDGTNEANVKITSGVYFIRIVANGLDTYRKVLILR